MMADAGRLVFGLSVALAFGATTFHLLRLSPRIFASLPLWPAADLHRAVSDRLHSLALGAAALAAAGILLEGTSGAAHRERLIAVTAMALCHLVARRLLAFLHGLRSAIASLGAGAPADAGIRRFDRVHRAYLTIEAAALALSLGLLTTACWKP
jgi:hypothetical protein